jgi:CPA1 family monovalent cation:H+ antiporter
VFLLLLEAVVPGLDITSNLQSAIGQIDFYGTIMNGLLAFLLFAGALHVDFEMLKNEKWPIGFMATFGVVVSTVVVAGCLWWAAGLVGIEVPFAWALVFGALISPTDPVAVLSLLKTVDVPESLKAKIAGESLFNDGVAVVAFTLLLAAAVATAGEADLSPWHIGELFLHEGVGGVAFGFAMGWLAYRLMASIDDHVVEVLISIAVCALTYAVSLRLHVSGPIAVVVAGLLIGNRGARYAMSEKVRDYMFAFWEIVDEVLNSVLFLLIGLEVLVLSFDAAHVGLMAVAIPAVLVGRLVSVSSPLVLRPMRKSFGVGSIPVLTWGGLRGGVSVALALSLPDSDYKPVLLAATYAVVVFSIVVQGLTVKPLIGKVLAPR